ncbi:MAG: vanadium-dependent haloperoxidase, partial [Woeseiaceae bacterium]
MNTKRMPARLIAAGLLMICGTAMASADSQAASREVIIDWNRVAQANIGGQPFSQTRSYAMVHIAMADAVIAIEGDYEPFHVDLKSIPHGASAKAAAAQAAHDVLVALVPANQATFDSALANSLAKIPPGQRINGIKIGKKVAQKVLEWRQNDGFASANPQPADFLASTLPGIWRQTVSGPAQYSALGTVEPFGLLSPTQFLPVPPPQLESDEYAADYNEVKDKGRASGSTRSEEETRLAQLVASAPGPYANVTNPFRLWSNVAIDLANAEHLSLVRTARMFALLTASIHDSLQTSHSSKFTYRLWRPENAVAAADTDNNTDTNSEIGWVPLLT